MKNRAFISFCINILVGILFSFPVFSAQSNVHYIYLNKGEFSVFDNDAGCKNISGTNGNSTQYFPESKFNSVSPFKSYGNNYSESKDKTEIQYYPPGFKEYLVKNISLSRFYLNPDFVNLTYLKDLRTTKMLC